MTQLTSQILGISLAVATAVGCLVYERLVKNFSFGIIIMLAVLFYLPLLIVLVLHNKEVFTADLSRLLHDKIFLLCAVIYVLAFITTPIWYTITRNQGVLVGSIYEVKYIVILALFYIFLGSRPITIYTGIGVTCAILSIYFISK